MFRCADGGDGGVDSNCACLTLIHAVVFVVCLSLSQLLLSN